MKNKKFDCPKCGAKKTIIMNTKLTHIGVDVTVYKCSSCSQLPEMDKFEPVFHDPSKQQNYYLD